MTITLIQRTGAGFGKSRGLALIARKNIIPRSVLGIGQTDQLIERTAHFRRKETALSIGIGTITCSDHGGFHREQQIGHIVQRRFFNAKITDCRLAIECVLIVDATGLPDLQRARRTYRIIRRRLDSSACRYLLLQLRLRTAQFADA